MGGEVSTDFKSSNRIEISWLVTSTIEFWLILRVPPWGGGGGWMGVESGERVPPTHMHMHVYDIIGNSQGFPKNPMEAAICMKLSCLPRMHVHVHVPVHAYMCMCVHMYGAPLTRPSTPPPLELQGAQNTKIQEVLN